MAHVSIFKNNRVIKKLRSTRTFEKFLKEIFKENYATLIFKEELHNYFAILDNNRNRTGYIMSIVD